MRAQNSHLLQPQPLVGADGLRTGAYTTVALVFFAANSLICRLALGTASIDALSFTAIRMLSGAVAIGIIAGVANGNYKKHPGSWISALALSGYATAFSFAFVSLSAGTGALILFAAVQATMIAWGLRQGERPRSLQWGGLLVALAGFVILMLPGVRKPSLGSAAMMAVAGAAWGVYSIRGGAAVDPVAVTGDNFLRAAIMMVPVYLLFFHTPEISVRGAAWASFSGAVTSGIGYVLWYKALVHLTSARAAVVQLYVPLIAVLGGIVLLDEHPTLGLIFPAVMIVVGVSAYLLGKRRPATGQPASVRRPSNHAKKERQMSGALCGIGMSGPCRLQG
jgi:drug/metabolite transporter (DMT)-like permease